MDPPRPEVPDSISKCHEAGIRVMMITGDQRMTAMAVGKEIGIVDQVIPEPAGGAHLDPQKTAKLVDQQLHQGLQQLNSLSTQELLEQRYERFRLLGTVVDAPHVANLD